jgi:hypothetical protein
LSSRWKTLSPHPEEPRSGVSKDEVSSWFETLGFASLLTMRIKTGTTRYIL